jgi:hypothetical protein
MLLHIRGRRLPARSRMTVIEVRLNIALCLFGIAAIITALFG